MHILHLLAPAPAGGLERVVQGLAIGQTGRGHSVVVAPVSEQWSEAEPFGLPLTRSGVVLAPITVGARDYISERRILREIVSNSRPDVVHSHGYHTNVIGRRVVMDLGVPFVATAHGFTGGSWKNRMYEWLDCRSLSRADAAIAVSQPLEQELKRRGVSSKRLFTVPNGFVQNTVPLSRAEARLILGVSPDARTVGWVGRMTHEKGLDVFIRCLALTPSSIAACIIGDGVERSSCRQLAEELGVSHRIVWAGLRNEAGQYFNAFDLLCQSSRTEGIPMVILEAMAMEVPVVATAVGGVPDVLSSSEATLVSPDDPSALARAITDSFSDSSLTASRAQAARRRLDRQFSGTTWLERHEQIYQEAIVTARKRSS